MTELLQHPEFGSIRTEKLNNEIWFCATDICRVLGFKNSRSAIQHHCFEGDVEKIYIGVKTGEKADGTSASQNVSMNFVNESGLYALIIRSNKPQAKVFRKWVTSEVLPAIRKFGFYSTNATRMHNAQVRADKKASKALFTEVSKKLGSSDIKLIAKQCLSKEYDVRRVLNADVEDVYMATLLVNKANGNKELRSLFYSQEGAEQLLAQLKK